jgi:hypothetical protein
MIIKVRVKPNSKKQDIKKISESEYVISVKERAEDNRANLELIKLLKKYFQADAEIVKGAKNKNKVVKIG